MSEAPNSYSFFDTLIIALSKKASVFIATFVLVFGGAVIYSIVAKPEFQSSSIFQVHSNDNDLLGLSKIGMLGSLMNTMGDESATELLASREFRVALINKFNLQRKWKQKNLASTLKKLDKYYEVSVIDDSFYEIKFYHTDPDSARMGVQFILDMLNEKQKELTQQLAKNQFDLYQSALDRQLTIMESLSDSIVEFMKTNRLLEVQTQAQQIMKGVADIDKEVLESTIQLKTLYENFWNKGNTEYTAIVKKIGLLQEYRKELLQGRTGQNSKLSPSLNRMPELGQQLKIMEGKVSFQQEILLEVIPQLERYRIQMLDTSSKLTILDPPYVPDYKIRPKRLYILSAGIFGGFVLSLFVTILIAFATMPQLADTNIMKFLHSTKTLWKNGSR